MRVLVISRNAWDDTNSIGNTLSNFLGNLDGVEFANIYFRSANPNNRICKRYYRVTEKDILRHWFSPKNIGRAFVWDPVKESHSAEAAKVVSRERALIRWIQKHNFRLAYSLSDYLWYRKKWLNRKLNSFIESFSPDVVVSFVKSAPQYALTIQYLREKYQIPVFSWIADDEYTALKAQRNIAKIEAIRYILKESSIVRGCSDEICRYYNSVFGCHAAPLYKGCDLSSPLKEKKESRSIKLVYAGNLLYGRMEIIRKIAKILQKNEDIKANVSLDIYSNTLLSQDEQHDFQDQISTRYLGQQPYDIIKERLVDADIVLHVESFEPEQILKTKYSFSTKIIDCLQSGSVLLAIGPSGLASIEYVKRIPGAYVIDDLDALEQRLIDFLRDFSSLGKRAEEIRTFAQLHHDIAANTTQMIEILTQAKGGV